MQLGPTCMFGGDFNAHNIKWGSHKTTTRGKHLKSFAEKAGLDIIAPPTPTRYGQFSASFIDLAITKNFLYPYDINSVPELSSDHNPVIINFYFNYRTPKPDKIIKTNWKKYSTELCNLSTHPIHTINNIDELDKSVESLTEEILNAHKNNSKEIDPKIAKTNSKLREIHTLRNKAKRDWQTTRNPAFNRLYNYYNNQAKRLKKEIYHAEWRDKLIALQPSDNTLWDTARKMRKKHTKISALNGPTRIAFTNTDKAEVIADSLQNQFTLNNLSDTETENLVTHKINDFNKIDTFPPLPTPNPIDIIKYIRKVNIHKAPGSDGITNNMLRNLPIITLIKIIHTINNIFKHQYFPKSWRIAIVIPILKPGKDPTDPSSYRPISLLPTLSKVTEHFILTQLNEHLNNNNILIPYQFGFKPKLSTTHQLLRAVEFITSGFENRFCTGAVFLDIQKAFDRVWINGLIYKLITHNIPSSLIKLITTFLTNRQFKVRIGNTLSKLHHIQAGVPQGAKLSPCLYSLFINDIPQKHNTTLCIYADDTAILTKNKNLKYITSALNSHLKELNSWFTKWKIAVNPSKTELVLFSKRRKLNKGKIFLQNTEIPWSQETKYLGVILDANLNWKAHINYIRQKFRDNCRKLFPLITRNSEMNLENKVLIYTAILRPVLTYASPTWAYASKNYFKYIDSCQNIILRQISKARWFMRNEDIRQALNIPPIKEFIKNLSINFFNNLENIDNSAIQELDAYTPNPNTRRPRAILL
ncbi:putative RNA-directed DNA polymerase from transposon X-element [Araneus ventricosus]|uniref:Putative RNA-directed DNA polymerase from transposon X-element n=1 Tax=Araneus ventricosus TaxID=182803 RepID=A0A4Y2TEK6_ARAVE|nr:putative RNA-directed DNA polymerase from transposon X-element [Araneus ventricosus]